MMRILCLSLLLSLAAPLANADAPIEPGAQASIDELAPDFELPDLNGTTHRLSDYRGKTVVLEWFNPGCPFVVHAYEKGPLNGLAEQHGEELVWLNINSGSPGKQGTGLDKNQKAKTQWKIAHPLLLDESGAVGKAFSAKTTPQMVVIDAEGKLRYNGALDNAPRGKQQGDTYEGHLVNAIQAIAAGRDVDPSSTKPYGCSVKYSN
jgi:peroxiredoxin